MMPPIAAPPTVPNVLPPIAAPIVVFFWRVVRPEQPPKTKYMIIIETLTIL